MALDPGWRGIGCMIVDQGDGTIDHPEVGLIAVRIMEFCRRWGIVDRVRNCGFPDNYKFNIIYCTSMSGCLLERQAYPSQREFPDTPSSPEKQQRCPQLWFDPILAHAVGADAGLVYLMQHGQVTSDSALVFATAISIVILFVLGEKPVIEPLTRRAG